MREMQVEKSRAVRLGESISREAAEPILMVGVHSALAAQLAQQVGFQAGWISGFEISAALGIADRNLLGCAEMVEAARRVTAATDLPVIVDADNGYGSALAMRRAARELAAVDAAGMCVEDNIFPKRNSFDPARGEALLDAHEFADRIAQTRGSLGGQPFLLIGRTEALISGRSLDEAIERAALYVEAGADLVVIHSKDASGRQAMEVASRWGRSTPLVAIPTAFPHLSPQELSSAGYRIVIYANHLLRASATGMRSALAALQDGRPEELEAEIVSMQEIFKLTA